MPRLLRDLGPEERAPVIATIRHEAEAAAWRTVPNAQKGRPVQPMAEASSN